MGKGQLGRLGLWRLYPFEALAEISDFAAGFVHRVPKKTNEVKADLQNSTASQGDDHLHTLFGKRTEGIQSP